MIRETEHGLIIRLKIVPNSSKNEIILEDEFIKVKVTAQPIENKANKALIEFLSKQFKIPKTKIQILKGETSKEKTVLLNTDDLTKNSAIISQLTKKLKKLLKKYCNLKRVILKCFCSGEKWCKVPQSESW